MNEADELNIFAKKFSVMSRSNQKSLLLSNQGIFAIKAKGQGVLGPQLNGHLQINGDMMSVEQFIFGANANKSQQIFFENLLSINESLAYEFLLRITGAIKKWKEDVLWLEVLEHYLHDAEKALEKDERILTAEQDINAHTKIPDVVKRHYPQIFKNIDILEMTGNTIKQTVQKIRAIELEFKEEESFVHKYLIDLRKRFPFLFEKGI